MRVRVLGSAAGGGYPQWNCRCVVCEAARAGERARPRTQSSLAIRGDDGPWFLVNASPDLRQQLETLEPRRADGVRAPLFAGVLLTDAEIDHTAGLLLLRESATPVRVFGAAGVERALRNGYPVLAMLERYCGAEWRTLEPERSQPLDGSSLVVEPFAAGGDAPRYLGAGGGARGERVRVPRRRDRRHRHLRARACQIGRGRGQAVGRERSRARRRNLLARRRTRAAGNLGPHRAGHGTSCRCRAPAGRSRRLPGWSGPARCWFTSTTRIRSCSRTLAEREEVVRAGVEVAYDGLEAEL